MKNTQKFSSAPILFNFALSNYEDVFELGYAILELDENFSNIDLIELLATINSSRRQAGLSSIQRGQINRKVVHSSEKHQIDVFHCLTLSNLGQVKIPEAMAQYVRRFDFILGVQAAAPYNCGML